MHPPTFVAVTVASTHHTHLARRVRQCGDTYRYHGHLDGPAGLALLVTCLCPDGHGVARLPWRGWVDQSQGRFDLVDLPTPASTVPTVAAPVDLSATTKTPSTISLAAAVNAA